LQVTKEGIDSGVAFEGRQVLIEYISEGAMLVSPIPIVAPGTETGPYRGSQSTPRSGSVGRHWQEILSPVPAFVDECTGRGPACIHSKTLSVVSNSPIAQSARIVCTRLGGLETRCG
jgi:hypothetical protein